MAAVPLAHRRQRQRQHRRRRQHRQRVQRPRQLRPRRLPQQQHLRQQRQLPHRRRRHQGSLQAQGRGQRRFRAQLPPLSPTPTATATSTLSSKRNGRAYCPSECERNGHVYLDSELDCSEGSTPFASRDACTRVKRGTTQQAWVPPFPWLACQIVIDEFYLHPRKINAAALDREAGRSRGRQELTRSPPSFHSSGQNSCSREKL